MHELPTTCRKSTFQLPSFEDGYRSCGQSVSYISRSKRILEVFPLYPRVIRRTLLGKGIYMHFPNRRCATGTDDEEEEGECHPLLELSSRVPHSTCTPLVTRSASIRPEHEVGFAWKRTYRADLNQR